MRDAFWSTFGLVAGASPVLPLTRCSLPSPYRCIRSLTNSESRGCKQPAFVGTQNNLLAKVAPKPVDLSRALKNLLCIYSVFSRKSLPGASTGNVDFAFL